MAVPVGALVAIPAIRLSGLFLALATLGFGIMVERLFYPRNFMFTTFAEGRRMPRPSWGSSDEGYYYVVLAFVVAAAIIIGLIHRGRLGRILRGLGDSPVAVSTLGLSTNMTRVIVFCIAAFFAAVAGILYGGLVNFATAGDRYYQSFTSLILLAVLALAPFREPWYAVFAGLTAVIPGYLTGADTTYWFNVIFGVFAILVSLQGGPAGMPLRLSSFFDRVGRRRPAPVLVLVPATAGGASPAELLHRPAPDVASGIAGLEVDRLTVRFGGLVAVNDLSFQAPMGRITGLIGPNGAGKTTTFNACSGLNRPSSGRILLHAKDVSRHSPAARARLGLGRSFQVMQLCESLTVFDNVALGRESSQAGARPASQLAARRADQRIRTSPPPRRSSCAASPTSPTAKPASCPPASVDSSSSPALWPARSTCCSSTNHPPASTATRRPSSATSCNASSTSAARASCSSSTTCRSSCGCASTSTCSTSASSSSKATRRP